MSGPYGEDIVGDEDDVSGKCSRIVSWRLVRSLAEEQTSESAID